MEDERTDRLRNLLHEAMEPVLERLEKLEEEVKKIRKDEN